jgi:hypothetical protein
VNVNRDASSGRDANNDLDESADAGKHRRGCNDPWRETGASARVEKDRARSMAST